MKRPLIALALAWGLTAEAQPLTGGLLGRGGAYSSLPAPSGCSAGTVPYFTGSPLALVCSPTVYAPATDTTTSTGTIAARNLTATALATPVITPPVSVVLSLLTTVTVVAGASLVDGDYFTLSDGSAVVYEFDNDANVTGGRVGITFTGAESAQGIRDLVVVAINGSTLAAQAIAAAADTLTVTLDVAGALGGVNSENVADAGFLVPVWGEPTHATTYGYRVVAYLNDGTSATSAEVQTTTGHATLSNANYNAITYGNVTGAAYYKLYRVTGTPAGGDAPPRLLYTGPLLNFSDTNAASTDGTGYPTTNTTGRILVGNGSAAAPTYSFASDPTSGWSLPSVTSLRASFLGSDAFTITPAGVTVWGLGSGLTLHDTPIRRAAAATLQLGAAPSATPIANTLIVGESGSGTNIAGANGTISSGAGTDGATGSSLIFKTPTAGVTANGTPQTQAETLKLYVSGGIPTAELVGGRVIMGANVFLSAPSNGTLGVGFGAYDASGAISVDTVKATRATLGSKSKALTDATPVAFATIPMATGVATAGEVIYRVVVTDGGTARQVISGRARYSAARDGATYDADVSEVGTQTTSVTSGTLTGAITVAGASDLLTFSADFDTDLGTPVLTIYYRFDSTDVLAITPL